MPLNEAELAAMIQALSRLGVTEANVDWCQNGVTGSTVIRFHIKIPPMVTDDEKRHEAFATLWKEMNERDSPPTKH